MRTKKGLVLSFSPPRGHVLPGFPLLRAQAQSPGAQKAQGANLWLKSPNCWRGEEGQEAGCQKLYKLLGNQVPTRNMCLLSDSLTTQS